MEKNNRTFQIAVVVGLLLLVSVVVGYQSSVTGNAPRQGQGGGGGPQAASCDADSVCEMNVANAKGLDTPDASITNLRSAAVVADRVSVTNAETDFLTVKNFLKVSSRAQPQIDIYGELGAVAAIRMNSGSKSSIISSTNGNVGIGTSNPQAELDVEGTVKAKYLYAHSIKIKDLSAFYTTSIPTPTPTPTRNPQFNAYACLNEYGVLFRSDTPCR